jgi:hypothetical protein
MLKVRTDVSNILTSSVGTVLQEMEHIENGFERHEIESIASRQSEPASRSVLNDIDEDSEVYELRFDGVEFRTGATVRHEKFGDGRILNLWADGRMRVQFVDEIKYLRVQFANLKTV